MNGSSFRNQIQRQKKGKRKMKPTNHQKPAQKIKTLRRRVGVFDLVKSILGFVSDIELNKTY